MRTSLLLILELFLWLPKTSPIQISSDKVVLGLFTRSIEFKFIYRLGNIQFYLSCMNDFIIYIFIGKFR